MRAVLNVLLLFTVHLSDTQSWNKHYNEHERYSRTRFLVAKHNYQYSPKLAPRITEWHSSPITTDFTPTTITSPILLHKGKATKRRRILRNERKKLRNSLKDLKIRENKLVRNSILGRINEINAEIRKYAKKGSKRRQRKHKHMKLKAIIKENKSNILEITTARNKYNNLYTWHLNNNTSLDKIIKKLNNNPEIDFSNEDQELKAQSDNTIIALNNKQALDIMSFNNSHNKFKEESLLDANLLSKPPKNNIGSSDHVDSTMLTTEFYEILRIMPNTFDTIRTESDLDKNKTDSHFTANEKIQVSTNTISKINYAELMNVQTTTMPPLKNVSLDTILEEFNIISNQIGLLYPRAHKYNMTKSASYPRRKTRCSFNKGGCQHVCYSKGSKKCSCLKGFHLGADKRKCIDINECLNNNGGCTSICHNTPGSYYCSCPNGLRLSDDLKTCDDVNECLLRNGHGPCQDTCENSYGSYQCSCLGLNGTRLGKDKHSCEDVNECLEGRSGCSHECVNTLGRAFCTCPYGMELGHDWKTCNDINECTDEQISKQCKYGCINTIGSYLCLDDFELQSDQSASPVPDHVVCPPLFPPKHGFLECSRQKGLKVKLKSRSGRRRVTNRPGMSCQLICPSGYKSVGVFQVVCGLDGQWVGDKSGKCLQFPHHK